MILETSHQAIAATVPIIAAGIFSNDILSASGLAGLEQRKTEGETLVGWDAGPQANLALRVRKINYVRSGCEFRVGSTPFDGITTDLKSVADEAFGELENTVLKWGVRGRFRDRMPAIGQVFFPGRAVGPWVSIGYHKNGFQLAHLFAQKLISLIEGRSASTEFAPFLVQRLTLASTPFSALSVSPS